MFAVACFAEYMWRPGGIVTHNLDTVFGLMVLATLIIGVAAALVGWLMHAIQVMAFGASLARTPEADDYDDFPPAQR